MSCRPSSAWPIAFMCSTMAVSSPTGHLPQLPLMRAWSRPISATVLLHASCTGARMLEVRDLSAGYGVIQILRAVNLNVAQGEIVALLGSNGAGKSTLNNVLSGICPPIAGSVRFDGEEIQ